MKLNTFSVVVLCLAAGVVAAQFVSKRDLETLKDAALDLLTDLRDKAGKVGDEVLHNGRRAAERVMDKTMA